MNLSLDLAGSRASLCASGYLSLHAVVNLSVLLRDLGSMEVDEIDLDLSQCSPVAVGALETLLDCKYRLAERGVKLVFGHPPRAVSKVFQIMGLRPNGELLAATRSGPTDTTTPHVD